MTHARRVHRARIAGRDARWRGPVPHEATTKEKARDKDDDRRQKKKRSTTARDILLECGGENHPHERRAAPARVRERVSSPVAVAAAPREGSKKSLRACCT